MLFKRILLVIPDQQLSYSVAGWLDDGLTGSPVVSFPVGTEQEANRLLKAQSLHKSFDLIIVQISIPADRHTPLNDKEARGLAFLRGLPTPTPSILIAPEVDSTLFDAVHALKDCVAIAADMQLGERLVRYAKEALTRSEAERVEERVRITFSLNSDNLSASSYCIEGIGFSYRLPGSIQIDARALQDLIDESKMAEDLTEYPHWERNLQIIGKQLIQRLFFDNYMSLPYGRVVGKRKTEIVFDIARGIHPVILEALIDPNSMSLEKGQSTFWMLKAPIYRRLRNEAPTDRYPLFQGSSKREPINCLIIESQVDGLVPHINKNDGNRLTLEPLLNVPVEAQWLEEYFTRNRQLFGIGEVLRISAGGLEDRTLNQHSDRTVKEWVKRELNRPDLEWQLVHYAGHCFYDEGAGKGYVFFPGDALVEELELSVFSMWLSRTRFVYLSGCNSSEENFVFELANNHVPAVLGFRWKIEDEPAVQYTKAFYTHLFEVEKSLEYAFLAARVQLKELCATKRTWAAPMLIMQLATPNTRGVAA